MVKWLFNVLAVVALASAQYAATQQNAPVLPKASSSWAPQQQSYGQPMIEQPAQQPALPQPQTYAPQPQPIQQQQPQVPAPQPETYAPQPAPQQQPPAPQPQAYAPAPQQQPAVAQPQTYAPQPAQQQPAPQPQTYAPAPQQQQPALPQPQGYAPQPAPQQQPPAPQPQAYAPAPQQQAPQQTYGRPQQTPPKPRPNFDCTARADGMYAMGKCQSQYILCLYGEPQLTTCPAGLTFDGEKCEYKNLCMNPTPPPPPPPQQQQPASGYGRQFNPYGQKPVQQQPPAPVETFCQENNFSEGYHTRGCSQTYYACSPVHTTKLVCAGGTFYDEEAQECGYKNHVPACGGSRPTPPPAQTQPLAPYGQQQAPALAPRVSYAPAPQPIYGQPMPQQQQPAPQQPMQTSYGYSQPAPQQQQPKAPIETFCQENNFSEGYHTKGCSQTYYACSPAHTMKLTCAGGTFYDEEAQECGYKHHVPACGGSRPTPPPAQTQPLAPYGSAPQQQQPMQAYGQPQTYAPAPQQQQPQAPQPQTYAPQPAQQQPAPQPQTYAPAPQQQQPALPQPQGYAPQPAPQQQPPAPQPQGYAPAPQQTYGQRQQAPPKPAETFCSERNLADGFHGRGCSSHFYVCAAGQTTRMECPLGLFYDQETNECGQKSVIVACGGTKPTQPPAQQPPMSGPYGQAPIARQPPPPPEFDCTGRKDGIYIRGCTSKYFVCIQGSVMSLSCPQGTFYSAFTEKCDYQAHVVECGGKAPEKTEPAQNPVMIPKSSYGPAPVQQQQPAASKYGQPQSPAQQAPAKPTRPCETLSNGIYGRKCSRFFFVCASQKTYDFICPKDHAFNLKTVKCAPKTEITTCPEFGVIEQPIQQTPAQPIEIKLPQANNYAAPAPVQQQQPQAPRTNYAAPAPVQQQQPQAPRTDYAAPAPQPIQQQQPQAPRNNYVAPAPQPIQQQQPVAPRTDYAAPAPQPIQQQQPQAPRADYAAPAPAPVQQQPQAPRTNYAAPAPVQQQQPQAPRADYAAPQPIQQQQPQAPRTDYAAPAPLQQQQPQGGY